MRRRKNKKSEFVFKFSLEIVSGRFDTSGSMIPLLVPEILPWVVLLQGAGIGYSSWI